MALITPSRAATLGDVLAAVATAECTQRRRQDMASAVRRVARMLGREPANVPADPAALNRRLRDVAPLANGVSRARWNNVRSLLRAALGLVRPVMAGRSATPMTPAWQALFDALPTQSERSRLSRLIRWLSASGVEPGALEFRHLELFKARLLADSLCRHPEKSWTALVYSWNRSLRVLGFPSLRLVQQGRRQTYTLPWSAFPSSLKRDADAWLDRLAGRDFSDDGPICSVRPETVAMRSYQLRSFASALIHQGRNPASLESLADLVDHDAFVCGLRFYYARRGNSSSTAIHGLATMLKSVARHWVHVNTAALERMDGVVRRLAVPEQGLTTKNRDRLRPFDDEANVARLLSLPQLLRRRADGPGLSPRRSAALAGIAVGIELLIVAPVRRQNLAAIAVGRHLLKVGRKLHLVIPGEEVKNGCDLEFELPARTDDLIDWYLRQHRPALAGDDCDALFPGMHGSAKTKATLGLQISRTIFTYTGLRVNAHLFRHIGAKLYLDAMPGSYEVMRRVLGHKAMDTTTRFYSGMEAKAAARHFDEVILRRQGEVLPTGRTRS